MACASSCSRGTGADPVVWAAPCPRVEMPCRGCSGILWLQTRAPWGHSWGRHSRDGFPGSIVRAEQRKQLGATSAHFQGTDVLPVAALPHKSLRRESTSAQISCHPATSAPWLHQLQRRHLWTSSHCSRDPQEAAGGSPAPHPHIPEGHPTISTAAWGEAAPGLHPALHRKCGMAGGSRASFAWPDVTLHPASATEHHASLC